MAAKGFTCILFQPSHALGSMPHLRHHVLPRARVFHSSRPWRNRVTAAMLILATGSGGKPPSLCLVVSTWMTGVVPGCWALFNAGMGSQLILVELSTSHWPSLPAASVSGTPNAVQRIQVYSATCGMVKVEEIGSCAESMFVNWAGTAHRTNTQNMLKPTVHNRRVYSFVCPHDSAWARCRGILYAPWIRCL